MRIKKILYSLLCLLIAGVIAFTACFFAIPKFNTWVKGVFKTTKVDKDGDDSGDFDNDSDIIVSDDEAESPLKLTVKKMAAQVGAEDNHTTYDITAELMPANTTDVVDMSIAWASECSENISEYMQLDHADGAFTATVTALKPFSTTINLTAKVRDRDIAKTVKLDYFSVYADFYFFASDTISNYGFNSLGSDFGVGFHPDNVYGSILPSKVEIKADIDFVDSIKSVLGQKGFNVNTVTKSCFLDYNNNKGQGLDGYNEMIFYKHEWFSLDPNVLFPNNSKQSFYNAIYNAIPNASNNNASHLFYSIKFDVTFYVTSGGEEIAIPVEYNDGDPFSIYVKNLSSLATPATDMQLGDGNYVFWG